MSDTFDVNTRTPNDAIVDPFESQKSASSPIVDPFESAPKEKAKPTFNPMEMVTDIPSEIGKDFSASAEVAKKGLLTAPEPGAMGALKNMWDTAKGVAAIPGMVFSPATGAYHSIVGHGMTDLEHAAGLGIDYLTGGNRASHDDPEKMYEASKGDSDKALMAMGPGQTLSKLAETSKNPLPPIPKPTPDPFGVTLTEGEKTGSLPLIRKEQEARRDMLGPAATKQAEEFYTQREGQLADANDAVTRQLDPTGNQVLAKSSHDAAEMAQSAVQREAARAKQDVTDAYGRAKEIGGEVHPDVIKDMPVGIREDLSNAPEPVYVDQNTPVASNMLKYLDESAGKLNIRNDAATSSPAPGTISGVSLEGVDQIRKGLSALRGDALKAYNTNPSDARAANAVINAFDDRINAAVNSARPSGAGTVQLPGASANRANFIGPPEAIDAWNEARALHSQRMKTYGNDIVGRKIQAIIGDARLEKDPASLQAVSDYIYGAGVKPTELSLAVAKRMQKILGPDSPEWAALRQGYFKRMVEATPGMPEKSVGKIATNIAEAMDGKGKALSELLFTPAQRSMLREYGELHRQLQVPPTGANWSESSTFMNKALRSVSEKLSGLLGSIIGHTVAPGLHGAGEYIGAQIGAKGSTMLENARNARAIQAQMPLVRQQIKAWQQAVKNQNNIANDVNKRKAAAAAITLSGSLGRLGIDQAFVLRLLQTAQGSGPGTSNAKGIGDKELKPTELPPVNVEPKGFADGGVPEADDTPFPDQPAVAPNPNIPRVYIRSAAPEGKDESSLPGKVDTPPAELPDDRPKFIQALDAPFSKGTKVGNKLTGEGGEERFQTWPERMLRSGTSLAHDVMSGEQPMLQPGLRREDFTDKPVPDGLTVAAQPNDPVYERAQDMAGLAGSGGIGGTGAEAGVALGSSPMLRPALKYEGKIYKAPVGGEHADAMTPELYKEYQKQALSGEDMKNFNFGFMNHKGQFLDRDAAMDYAVNEGLITPEARRQGALTTQILEDSSVAGAPLAAAEHAQPFYSAVEKTVADSKNQKMQGVQWANWLKNQPGVKPDEMQYTGLDSWLRDQKGPVTKEQVQDFLDKNKVQVNDVEKGAGHSVDPHELASAVDGRTESFIEDYRNNEGRPPSRGEVADFREQMAQEMQRNPEDYGLTPTGVGTKYKEYQLPGGENYREHLLTLPYKKAAPGKGIIDEMPEWQRQYAKESAYAAEPDKLYQSQHWDEPNVLAHVRHTDRDVGGVPSLHLEELQSDWHQEGRKRGYEVPPEVKERVKNIRNKFIETGEMSPEDRAWYNENHDRTWKGGVPDAPFKATWPELAMKRMVQKAAAEGKDRISWTPGESSPTNPKVMGSRNASAELSDKGLRGFYNDILPKTVEKMGKQYGVKVKQGELPGDAAYNPKTSKVENTPGQKVYYFDIPPKMKEDALGKGFALFSDSSEAGAPLSAVEKSATKQADVPTPEAKQVLEKTTPIQQPVQEATPEKRSLMGAIDRQRDATPAGTYTKVGTKEQQAEGINHLMNYLDMVGKHDKVGQFINDNGIPFYANDKTFAGARQTPKMCYMNAAHDALEHPDHTYVEGYVTVHGIPIQHAWTVDSTGQIFDQTIKPNGAKEGLAYYGVPFSDEYLQKSLLTNKYYGLLGHRSMKTASKLLDGTNTKFRHDIDPDKLSDETIADRIQFADQRVKSMPFTDQINTPERTALRQKVADDLYNHDIENRARNRVATIVLGLPGAGKTSFTRPLMKSGALEIEGDNAKALLPEFKGGVGAWAVHEEASSIMRNVLHRAVENGDNLVWPRINSPDKIVKDVQALKDAGYKVNVKLIDTHSDYAAESAVRRFLKGGRYVSPEMVKAYGDSPRKAYQAAKDTGHLNSSEVHIHNYQHGGRRGFKKISD